MFVVNILCTYLINFIIYLKSNGELYIALLFGYYMVIYRITFILNKCEDEVRGNKLKLIEPHSEVERSLMLKLVVFNEVVEKAFIDKAPNKICEYIYEVANLFNRSYHDNRIISEENADRKISWIKLISVIKSILETGLDLLGFEIPDKM